MSFNLRLTSEPDGQYYVILEYPWVDRHRIVEEWGFQTEPEAKTLYKELEENYIKPQKKTEPNNNGSLQFDIEQDLEYFHKTVGTFKVTVSKAGRTVWFAPLEDMPHDAEPFNIEAFLKSLEDEGVSYRFHHDATSAFMVVVPPRYNISKILKETAEAYAALCHAKTRRGSPL